MGSLPTNKMTLPSASTTLALPPDGGAVRPTHTAVSDRETVVLYPTLGHLAEQGNSWRVQVRGSIYEPGVVTLKRRLMLRVLRRVMDATPDCFESDIFRDRISAFAAGAARGRSVLLRVGSHTHELEKPTRRDGQFAGILRIGLQEAETHSPDGWLRFRVVTADAERRSFAGRALLLPAEGTSVISDIDDTIKHSEVHCRRSLLANTFLREFSTIEGMASLYRQWAEQGATFHYISSSPWQLYLPLSTLCENHGFPAGTFHLRLFRLRDQMLRKMLPLRRPGKGVDILRLVKAYPHRRFILIGDSAEHDPELYGAVARRFPDRIQAIYIREISGWTVSRAQRAFRGLPSSLWHVFRSPRELPVDLDPSGLPLFGRPLALA